MANKHVEKVSPSWVIKMQVKTPVRCHYSSIRMAKIRRTLSTKSRWGTEPIILESAVQCLPKLTNAYSTPGVYSREMSMNPRMDTYSNSHSSFIHNRPKLEKPKCPKTGEWIIRLWCSVQREYYLGWEELPIHTMWMNWTGIMPSKEATDLSQGKKQAKHLLW